MIEPANLREHCRGDLPLTARLEPWMMHVIQSGDLFPLLKEYGSPLNVIATDPMARNIAELNRVAAKHRVNFRVYFARKSNKCLSFVERAIQENAGVDAASENEVLQCLASGVAPADLICTAAVKSESLLSLCVERGICIAIDNHDELQLVIEIADNRQRAANVAIRLGGFEHLGHKLPTRFGFDVRRDLDVINTFDRDALNVQGVHFHLDGYDASQRVSAIHQSLQWVHGLRSTGHEVRFLDMGGGFPISYLEDENQWTEFWDQHDQALLGKRRPITYRNHRLGKHVHDGIVIGSVNSYPYYQSPVRSEWFANILASEVQQQTIASQLRGANLQLRCEPGRSLMDGCGMTIARVEFRKCNADGDWLFGVSMNRTQCRTSSDDFLVDPILIAKSHRWAESMSGYLVGTYCTESELISLRRLHFPHGVARGDLIVFPNTAGYLMHFLESRSHQFPLATNVTLHSNGTFQLDPINP